MASTLQQKEYTPLSTIQDIHDDLYKTFYSGKTRDVKWRKEQLKSLAYLVQDNMKELSDAIQQDLGRSHNETYIVELGTLLTESVEAVHNVDKWAKPVKPSVSFDKTILKPTIYKEPVAPALIIAPWNYPVLLALSPLVGAIAAGCPAVVKCSEITPTVGALIAKLVPQYLDQSAFRIVLGEVDVISKLLELPWGHIFYTGNSKVARIITAAAAKHLTPITLELGGKSPVVIDPALDDLDTAAKRILWGKRVNCGQTCISPDYVVVTEDRHQALLDALSKEYKRIFPQQDLSKDDYPRIVSHNHFDRLQNTLSKSKGRVVLEGQKDRDTKLMGMTVVDGISWDDEVMKEEIFGPILPIVQVRNVNEAIVKLQGSTPLALYVFSRSPEFVENVRKNTQSGAIVTNDVLLHFTIDALPFGGVGESGVGSYHGKRSFDVFTHERSAVTTPFWADFLLGVRYYPYTEKNTSIFRAVQVKKINFSRPKTILAHASGNNGAGSSSVAKSLVKYAVIAAVCALAANRLSWIIRFAPKWKLVKVD